MKPAVSIILPYYEGNQWLKRTVESVQYQTVVNWELIVVDDGSVNSASAVIGDIADVRIRLLRIPHGGKGRALNRGVFESKGDHVCFIDQDDRMLPGRLEAQLRALKTHIRADGVYSDYERRHYNGKLIDQFLSRQVSSPEAIHLMAVGCSPVTMQTLMLKKTVYEQLGGFSNDPDLTGLDDLDFFVRLFLARTNLIYEPGAVQTWIRHDQNYSNSAHFQDARLHWLKRLDEHARDHLILRRELKHFRFHTHSMRGLYFLETRNAELAVPEFYKALFYKPRSINSYYLFLKSVVLAGRKKMSSHFAPRTKKM